MLIRFQTGLKFESNPLNFFSYELMIDGFKNIMYEKRPDTFKK